MIVTLVFEKNDSFFAKNMYLVKIAENCDQNIDPRWVDEKAAQIVAEPIFVKINT
jgi:hypothetical protein